MTKSLGDTYVTREGYVYEYVGLDSGHPRESKGYVAQHTLVMERILGRHLVDGETVHHLNGVREDNRPENLELWCKPQPTGIRAADAVEWAREILRLYGDDGV